MKLRLVETPGWPSPYGPRGALVPLPQRMRRLHPDALASFDGLPQTLVYTDVYRSPASSLEARARKRGVQAPGYSAHNFGLAVDLDVAACLKRIGWDKPNLDAAMAQIGWRCYRADHRVGVSESWHYTFGATAPGSAAVEAVIQRHYGADLRPDAREVQRALARLKLYDGAVDGDLGPQSRRAIMIFQRQWALGVDGKAGSETGRLLAVVAAET